MIKLSEKEKKILFQSANEVWDEIAYDVLQGVAVMENKDIYKVLMRRADVIEIVMDAGRLEEQVRRAGPMEGLSQLFPKEWNPESNRKLHRLMKEAFPFKSYGM